MYKTTTFSLVKPNNNKSIMLDDTCYFVGFDTLMEADITRILLNKEVTQNFIQSIAFKDAKRMITKDLLMRIDLNEIINNTHFTELQLEISGINIEDWENYKGKLTKKEFEINQQLNIFSEQALHTTTPIRNAGFSAEIKDYASNKI